MRIRTIRPEFWESPQVGALCTSARLTFIGLWNLADREGRLKDRPEHIAIKLFPYDRLKPCRLDAWLGELARAGLIVRYQRGGEAYLAIPTWRRHQRPHPHEAPSEIPPPARDEHHPAGDATAEPLNAPAAHAGIAPARDGTAAARIAEAPSSGASPDRSRPRSLFRAAGNHSSSRAFKPTLCRLATAVDERPFEPAVTFNGRPRHGDPCVSSVNPQSFDDDQDPPGISYHASPTGTENPPNRGCAAAAENYPCGERSRDGPAAPAKEGEWDEQDAWLRRFLRSEQKAFVGAHLEPLLADYAFWCRLSEAAGGLSREFLEVEFAKMALWLGEHPTRGPTVGGVRRFVARWIERAAEQSQGRMRIGG
jgi:hypothetical protein